MTTRRHRRPDGGFVLVTVLWIMAILTVISLGFAQRAMLERRMAWYAMDHAQALELARGAVERGMAELANKAVLDMLQRKPGYTGYDQRWARPMDLIKEGIYAAAAADDRYANDVCVYRISDCESRISINDAPEDVLEEVDGLGFSAVRRIMTRRRGGDRGEFQPRMVSIDELRDARGIDDRDWYGRNPGEGLRDMLTVWGDGRINVNTAPAAVLGSLPDVGRDVADQIVEYRRGDDGELYTGDDRAFGSLEQLADKLEVRGERFAALERHCKVDSSYFTIDAYATRRGGKIVARCTAVVQISWGNRNVLQWSEDVFGT